MIIDVQTDLSKPRRWLADLCEGLAGCPGVSIRLSHRPGAPLPAGLGALLQLERLVVMRARASAADPVGLVELSPYRTGDAQADLVVDLVGGNGDITVTCGGLGLVEGLVAALLAGTTPLVAVTAGGRAGPERRLAYRLAVETPDCLLAALGQALDRMRYLVDALVRRGPAALPSGLGDEAAATPADGIAGIAGVGGFAAASLGSRISARIARLTGRAPRWRVATRAEGPVGLPSLAGAAFDILPDDGRRFYADPFVFDWGGRRALFVEELPFSTGRGILSVSDIGADGRPGPFRPIIDDGCHLSWPMVFLHDGVPHMIPETTERRSVELWRTTGFPDGWERVATLIDDVDLADVTLLPGEDGGLLLLAASREPGLSSWEALDAWTAPQLEGPWTRIGAMPLLLDVAAARPAGLPFRDDGRLIRPFQDCRGGYGRGIGFAEVTQGGGSGPGQRVLSRFRPQAPILGLHSYNRGAGLEVVDLFTACGPGPVRLTGEAPQRQAG